MKLLHETIGDSNPSESQSFDTIAALKSLMSLAEENRLLKDQMSEVVGNSI